MARCGATEICPDQAYLNGLCKFHNDCKHYAEANGREFQPERFGHPTLGSHVRNLPYGFDPDAGYTHGIDWTFSDDEALAILLHDADRIDRPGGPRPAPAIFVPMFDADTYGTGAYVAARGSSPEHVRSRAPGLNWDYHEYLPRSTADRQLCVSCFSSWERMAWPILRPWLTMDHFCERCARLKPAERRWLHDRVRRLRSHKLIVQQGLLEQIRREWRLPNGDLPSVQFAVAKRQEEIDDLKETFVCVLCWSERTWRNDWICKPCYGAWLRAGKPYGTALVEFGERRRKYRMLHPPGGSGIRLSARQSTERRRNYRTATYTSNGRVDNALIKQVGLDASGLSWRDRLQAFRHEVLRSALPVEVTFTGSPSQVTAAIHELVAAVAAAPAEPPAAQFAPASGSPRPAPPDKQKCPTLERRAPYSKREQHGLCTRR